MNSARLFIVHKILGCIPETKAFGLKRALYRWAGAEVGTNTKINSSVKIIGVGSLSIGSNTWIGPETLIVCSKSVRIGNNCDIAPKSYIGDGTHSITPEMDRIAGIDTSLPITISDGCWLGANSCILPGVNLGKKCVVAAGGVVTQSFGNNVMIGGVPAKIIKTIESTSE